MVRNFTIANVTGARYDSASIRPVSKSQLRLKFRLFKTGLIGARKRDQITNSGFH